MQVTSQSVAVQIKFSAIVTSSHYGVADSVLIAGLALVVRDIAFETVLLLAGWAFELVVAGCDIDAIAIRRRAVVHQRITLDGQ